MLRFARALAGMAVLGAIISAGSAAAQAGPVGSYVVVLKPGVADVPGAAAGLTRAHGGTVGFVYEHALRGFSMRASAQAASALGRNPLVAYVEADQEFTISAQTVPTGIQRIFADDNPNLDIDGFDDERVDVDVAIIDTGIDLDHPDLNVVGSTNCASGGPFSGSCGSGGDDGNGHGTHVAGSVAAIDNGLGVVGVAPGARLWAVRVLNNNGSGYTSWIVAGMDWVTAQGTIEVANMSLGGGVSQALDDAANDMADAGVAVAVAAGNSDADAKDFSPARAQKVLTVSALADFNGEPGGGATSTCRSDQDDTLADFSNWGATIEIAAPGVCILSTWLNAGYNTISGTSMASPHAAGALAVLASKGFSRDYSGVSGLYSTLRNNGNANWIDDSPDRITEPLLDVSSMTVFNPVTIGGGGEPPPPDTTPPAAPTGLTAVAGNASVSLDWANNSEIDLAGYNVYRSTTSGSGYAKVNALVTSSAYTDSGLTNGTPYYYVVRAVDTSSNESASSTEASATPTESTTGTNVSLSGSSASNGSTWTASVTTTVISNGSPASGVSVSGTWSNGAIGTASCETTSGQCTVSKSGIPKRVGSVTFTVSTLDDSTEFGGTKSIVVAKP